MIKTIQFRRNYIVEILYKISNKCLETKILFYHKHNIKIIYN